jgi:hypothetical protein
LYSPLCNTLMFIRGLRDIMPSVIKELMFKGLLSLKTLLFYNLPIKFYLSLLLIKLYLHSPPPTVHVVQISLYDRINTDMTLKIAGMGY